MENFIVVGYGFLLLVLKDQFAFNFRSLNILFKTFQACKLSQKIVCEEVHTSVKSIASIIHSEF